MLLVGSNIPQVDTVGAETTLISDASTDAVGDYYSRPFCEMLTSSLVILGYCKGSGTRTGTILGASISGTTITPDTSSSTDLATISGWGSSLSVISTALRYNDTSIVIPKLGYAGQSNTKHLARAIYNSGSAFTLSSNQIQADDAHIRSIKIASIDSTYGLMAWATDIFTSGVTNSYVKIAVVTLSSPSVGTVYSFTLNSSVGYVRDLVVFDSTYAVVVYELGSSLYARLITMSGTTISTVGSAVSISCDISYGYTLSMERINSSTAYLYATLGNYPTDNHIRVYPINLSGGAITIGSSFVAVNNTTRMSNPPSNNMTLAPVSTGTVGLYSDPDDSYYPYFLFRIGVDFKNTYKLFSEAALILDVAVLTDKKILMIYAKTRGTSVPIYGRVITLK